MVVTRREKERGRCSNESMEDGSEWTQKTKAGMKRCYKLYKGERSPERRSARPEKM